MKRDELAKYLNENRLAAGLTQGDVATKLGYSTPQFISNWERGISSPPITAVSKLSKMYNISEHVLFELMVKASLDRVEAAMRNEFKSTRKSHDLR